MLEEPELDDEELEDPEPDDLMELPANAGRFGRAWRERAACKQMDTRMFFPAGHTGVEAANAYKAKRVCAGCPVRASCLAFALVTNQQFGIWGGCDEQDLWKLRRQRRAERRRRSRPGS